MAEKKKLVKREVRKAMGKTAAKPRAQSSKSTRSSKNAQDVVPEAEVQFGREICGEIGTAESREWLVTNGIGGFASGTVAGSMTRRYHGLLVAALQPPVGRTHLLATLDEIVHYAGSDYSLAAHHWASGTVDPKGFHNIESFRLEGTKPVWTYALADVLLEKRVWMRQGENTTYIQYTLLRASSAVEMDLKALVNYRDFHSSTHAGDWHMKVEQVERGVMVLAFDDARPFYLKSTTGTCEARHEWYRGCYQPEESGRGLDASEDHLFAAMFHAKLEIGSSFTIVASTEAGASLDVETAQAERANHEVKLFSAWQKTNETAAEDAPSWLWQLVLAADQFIVKRSLPEEPNGRSIIAGYHWFADWGRDTMIALPGLTLTTGRFDVAKQILLAFSRYVDGGMLPNNFPDAGGKPEYNTVDAGLWYFEAVRQYFAATQDTKTLQSLFPVLAAMIDAHVQGTRYNIHVDPADGLIYAGGPGVQLTWMDAKLGDWVVTPRTGKPVEINALWINALHTMLEFARLLTKPGEGYEKLGAKAGKNFQKFWNAERNCCYDVIDVPGNGDRHDKTLRPNQIFAVSLPVSPLSREQQKAVVDVCAQRLLTSYGLRSLAPGEPGYQGHYGGSPHDRDAAYHQGPVWGWLLGPFVLAHLRVYRDRAAAMRFLDPLGRQIFSHGLGTLSEIFDGDAPFHPTGCVAQAWSVGEVLRAWGEVVGSQAGLSYRGVAAGS
jgi:predicted glycogen debranching enzyme